MRMYSSGIYIQFRACSESRYIMKGVQRGEIRTGGKGECLQMLKNFY